MGPDVLSKKDTRVSSMSSCGQGTHCSNDQIASFRKDKLLCCCLRLTLRRQEANVLVISCLLFFQLPLPGYVEAFPHPRYPQESPTRLPLEYKQALEQRSAAPSTVFHQSQSQVVKNTDSMPLSSLSTSALVQAIRQEVAKLAKKQNDMFEF